MEKITLGELEVITAAPLVIVDFFATWCGPCKVLAKTLEELKKEVDDLVVLPIDIEENDELVDHFNIRNVPTLHIYKNGELTATIHGAVSKERILTALK